MRLRDSINKIDELISYANEIGHEVIAITEHDTVSNYVKIEKAYKKIKEKNPNFKIIRGNEIYLCRDGLNQDNFIPKQDKYFHFILLARNLKGNKQIREISTRAWLRSYMSRGMRRVPTYYQDLIDIIGKEKGNVIGSTACFKAGTQVETMHGWKNIENIQAGDFVINRYGEWEEVIEPTAMSTHQYGYSFEVTGNERPIVCTDNHEFLVITNNSKKPRWVQAKDLNLTPRSNSKHIALEPINYNCYSQKLIIYKQEWNNSYLKETQFSHRQINLPEEIIITPELMRFFGLFLGDGCISLKQNPRISFTFNEKEYETYMQSFINKASEELGITWSVNKKSENHRVDITSSSVDLINLFYYLFGDVKANTKYIPHRLRISKELDYELIFGYLLADGYFRTRTNAGKASGYTSGEFTSASVSKQLSYNIYQILNELNITSSISYSKERIDNNGVHHKEAWYVTGANKILGSVDKIKPYTHKEVVNIFEEAAKVKEKDFITIDGVRYRKIRFKNANKIELNETVYCLNNTTHSFKCENLIVHNCLGGALPTQILKYKETKDKSLLDKIYIWINQMDNLFGHGNFFFEMQPSNNQEQIYVNKFLLQLSKELNIPYIITTDSHYLKKEDRKIHKAYLNAQNGEREVDDFYATTYLMNDEEIREYFDYFTEEELQIAYQNILNIKNMCEDYSILKPLKIPELDWKKSDYISTEQKDKWFKLIPQLYEFYISDYYGDKVLSEHIMSRLNWDKTLQNQETYSEINSNLEMIAVSSEKNKTHWSAYFLNLQKIIDLCWDAGSIVGPGRGSGVGFILLYILGITQINPLRETTKTFAWRFLNPDRVSVLDVDFDIEGGRREKVLNNFRKYYGQNRVANVTTFGTEKSKSAILTAARGLGIDVDIAQYLSSLIPSDRGLLRTLDQCMYGDEENDYKPIKQFVFEMTENYPEIWEVAHKIEGLICRMGVHAGGVVFKDEDFTESGALMRAPDGTIITQFELHDLEDCGDIKYDALSVEAMDKIHNCLDLLVEYGYVEAESTLKETYEKVIGVYNLERNEPEMWKMIWEHKITSLFQMEQQSGIQGIALVKPKSVDDLATLNSVIRLMAQEKGAEQPLNKFARFKENINLWYNEMKQYGLTEKEIKVLEPIVKISYGICESQEKFMELVQLPECGGFDLTWADKLRKSIAKKNPAEFERLEKEYFQVTQEKGLSKKLCNYVWKVLVCTSKGYGFNASHTLAYSLIALQEMNLAYKYPIIFWNCACLISDSGGAESEEINDEENIRENNKYETIYVSMENFELDDESENSNEDDDINTTTSSDKKKKPQVTNYGKIATAIGKMQNNGIQISSPNINKSSYTFSPDVENSIIRYGLSGIVKIGDVLIHSIIDNRPYINIEDFLSKVKLNKPQMINLIKSGAFDDFGDRVEIMKKYIYSISDIKKRLTLQNMRMLIEYNLLPEELNYTIRVFNFNKYLKNFKENDYYNIDDIALTFLDENYSIDSLYPSDNGMKIKQTVWDKIYKKEMNPARDYIKLHQEELLEQLNSKIVKLEWDKYCTGTISKWEMDSISCYLHEHELASVKESEYGLVDFFKLPEEPIIDQVINIKGKQIPLFKINRIMGTVLDKNKTRKTVTLLTKNGVVNVRIFGDVFNYYDKQISEKNLITGKKKVLEKSIFTRGNKIIVTGIRRGDDWISKKYSRTPYHLVEQITTIDEEGNIKIKAERIEQNQGEN